ncbi:hypothetical protein CMI45_01220 [Candidatus Pacearchaeota archaeon]|nr:hypothetical protein [Candidatus Pacearchaeota archaeon]
MGLAIIFVEKRYDFPVRRFNVLFRRNIRKINPKLSILGECTVCFSFWAALISDIFLFIYSDFNYFLWPLSGFATSGLVWVLITYLNLIDNDS